MAHRRRVLELAQLAEERQQYPLLALAEGLLMEAPVDPDQVGVGLCQPLLPFAGNGGDRLRPTFQLPGQLAVGGQGVVDSGGDVLLRLVQLGAVLGIVLVAGLALLLAEVVDRTGAFEVGVVGGLAEVSIRQEHPPACLRVDLLLVLGTGLLLGRGLERAQ